MHLTEREWWTLIHGMILGALFLLAFSGGLAGLYSLRPDYLTPEGLRERVRRLKIGISAMAITAWLTVITGTWIVYPWYREKSPDSPKSTAVGESGHRRLARVWNGMEGAHRLDCPDVGDNGGVSNDLLRRSVGA